ncbi:hypothetical protein FISHEDRAFT_56186 [Fistulina hepatica ATCC 64428]|uniref:Uncharacterized protein n=1 Tax=Fistulina hepatica ATCC 64428 TaxID=1128425 RepID=A0A0D7ALP7_9AGAR|nr:hypothetical protein FISHEDRAFT_56186 [Fistulina hepatica ATCC 64428]
MAQIEDASDADDSPHAEGLPSPAEAPEPDERHAEPAQAAQDERQPESRGIPWRWRILSLFVLSFSLWYTFLKPRSGPPQIIYASRYSKEFKYRPAASPIITETLKDGRLRIRGAAPTMSSPPKSTPKPDKTKRKKRDSKKSKRTTKTANS